MIHIFRIYAQKKGDFLEFVSREALVDAFRKVKNPAKYQWETLSIQAAIKQERRIEPSMNLRTMKENGVRLVIKAVINGHVSWYSPTASNAQGIPSEYSVAVHFFTDACKYFRVTSKHHEVFEIVKDIRFRELSQQVIDNILGRVRQTRCATRLDKYLDMNLRKLKNYGVEMDQVNGTYIHIKDSLSQQKISCTFFNSFMLQLMDICIEKEKELVGENRHFTKRVS